MATTSISLPKTKFELEFNQGSIYSDEERDAVLRVLAANAPSCGSEVLSFEKEFAEFTSTSFGIAVGNATQGLEIAVKAAIDHFPKQDEHAEVIVPTVSWISTASSAALAGATVKFADVCDPSLCVDIDSIKRLVSPRTAAVIVVHLFGRSVDCLTELVEWLHERGILVIEDCAHAVAAADNRGHSCGSIGDIGVFSFHQQKNMVTLGEGGMCVTSNPKLRALMIGFRSLSAMSYDPKGKYLAINSDLHPMENRYWLMDFADHGHNFRMLDMQAAVGRVQLRKVKKWNARRKEIAMALHEGLKPLHKDLRVASIDSDGHSVHSWHVFHVLVGESFPLTKEEFMWALLNDFGIKAWNHYSPMHLATSFRSEGLGKIGDCPVAENLFEQYVSLPIHPRLTDEAVAYMIDSIRSIASRPKTLRLRKNPLIQELLALSESSKTTNLSPTSVSENAVVQSQWKLFRPLIQEAVNDGFFSSTSTSTHEGSVAPIFISRAPGRIDLMGGNDDYTGGLVFECTTAEATFVSAQMDKNKTISIRNRQLSAQDVSLPVSMLFSSEGFPKSPTDLAADLKAAFSGSRWQLYVVGVLLWLQMRFPTQMFSNGTQGLSILLWGNVPLNRGVSSSASVEVAVMKAAAHVFGISLCGEVLATACQWVENHVCSSACGLMDQMAVTVGAPFMAMKCQPAILCIAPPLPEDLTIYALDSGVSHEISGIEYEAARAAAFMGYKIICALEGLAVVAVSDGEIPRYTDSKYNGYLANMSPSVFARRFEAVLPVCMLGSDFLAQYGQHVDPATSVNPDHVYNIQANTKYAVYENNRVNLFYQLLKGCPSKSLDLGNNGPQAGYVQLGELMYQSHDSYTECGLGSTATCMIVDLVRNLGPSSGLFGAKITGGGAGGTIAIIGLKSAEHVFQEQVVQAYTQQRKLPVAPHVFIGSSPSADLFGIQEYK